ncbi:MAG TPA: ABC-2 family transporter protein [Terriglobia bacterium]|nr:ABC-2 family transporter protein [Terriglobia bacterium]
MKRHFRLFAQYFAQYAKVRLAYKADFLIAFFSSMAATVLGFGFVLVLFTKIPHLQDWSFNEVMFLYGFSLIPLGFFNVVSWNLYDFSEIYVIEGKFDRVLLRPVSTLFQVIFEKFRLESLQEVVTGIAVVSLCLHRLHITLGIPDFLWFGLMIVCGAIIYMSVFLILTAVSFWFEDRVGVVPPVFNMLTFGRYPLTIYNVFIQFMLSWIIPFGFATFYPTTHFLRREAFAIYFHLVPVVAAIFGTLAIVIWNRGVANYSSTGT